MIWSCSCMSSVALLLCGPHMEALSLNGFWLYQICPKFRRPLNFHNLLVANFLLMSCLGVPRRRLDHGRMVCDLGMLIVLCCDCHPRVKVTKQFNQPEVSYAKATVLPNASEVLPRLGNFEQANSCAAMMLAWISNPSESVLWQLCPF